MSFSIYRSKACKKELRQKIQFASTNQNAVDSTLMSSASSSTSSSVPISAANSNSPSISGPVGGISAGPQGAMGNVNNLQHPPPPI